MRIDRARIWLYTSSKFCEIRWEPIKSRLIVCMLYESGWELMDTAEIRFSGVRSHLPVWFSGVIAQNARLHVCKPQDLGKKPNT